MQHPQRPDPSAPRARPRDPVTHGALRSALGIGAALLCFGCESPTSDRHAELDRPLAVPAGQPAKARSALEPRDSDEVIPPEKAAECGRGTGRTPEGNCVQLTLRSTSYGQRVQIPAGRFVMGDVPSRYDASASRQQPAVRWSANPPRYVDVGSFFIDVAEVTREAYAACEAEGRCTPAECPPGSELPETRVGRPEDMPQTCVTHAQAQAFCAARGGRLPHEAEWEYAARGPDARIFPWGNEVRDELPSVIVPIQRTKIDASYFGVIGLGSNAVEWVADVYDDQAGLAPFLAGPFRDDAGPVAEARRAHELAIGAPSAPGVPLRHVVKISRVGSRWAARSELPATVGTDDARAELEGWPVVAHGPTLGFRCAADLNEETPLLTVPQAVAKLPVTTTEGRLEIFGGVAEAVSRSEAERFCPQLRVPAAGGVATDWRLPTREEIRGAAASFRGPGPFWASDGALGQTVAHDPSSPWVDLDAELGEALAARCVRDL